jgi:hypothetical protein
MNIQSKFLGMVKELFEKHGYDYIHHPDWANTGTVFAQKKNSFDNALGFNYDFQNSWGNATIQIYPGNAQVKKTCGYTDRNCVLHSYFDYSNAQKEFTKIFAKLESMLK